VSERAPGRPGALRGGLMVCGTASHVGKSVLVVGLCRWLARRGVRVAPFKAQNMALNSFVTASGHEIGRAQAAQAMAAGVEPEVAINPVLLKPAGEGTSQLVVMGRPAGTVRHHEPGRGQSPRRSHSSRSHLPRSHSPGRGPGSLLDVAAYRGEMRRLLPLVLDALADLRARYDVVICEGAGSPAEINLFDHDIANLRVAEAAGLPAVVVGDIDRGGVFAALYGTVALLPDRWRRLVRGFVVNKLRGEPSLLGDGLADLERRCGVPTLGVVPYAGELALDAEDSLALDRPWPPPGSPAGASHPAGGVPPGGGLDVAVVRLPRIANFTDLDPLCAEPGVGVRLVDRPSALGDPDLVVLPGSKATVSDLAWLRDSGLAQALAASRERGSFVLGICGGYQMLGRRILDGVESDTGCVPGLGWLDLETRFEADKVTRQRQGMALGRRVRGYQIHHGRPILGPGARPWLELDDLAGAEAEGASDPGGRVRGTSLHGLLEEDEFRGAFLEEVSRGRGRRFAPAGVSFSAVRNAYFERLADLVEAHLDLAALERTIAEGGPPG
jgi:adenosylcobyric acid synthase